MLTASHARDKAEEDNVNGQPSSGMADAGEVDTTDAHIVETSSPIRPAQKNCGNSGRELEKVGSVSGRTRQFGEGELPELLKMSESLE